ncbi:MAG: magnesium chelatase ATPase subunit D, partial [Sulfitobacter sp.]|nr:magnesium chelatase ATPase subunit D [Sulfitobacter sp.]
MTPWARALLALRLSQADPVGCGGMVLRCRPSPARDALLTCLPDTPTRLHPAMGLEALEGGLDIPGSLSEGKLVAHAGLLDGSPRTFLLAMAERCPPLLANCLCDALDRGAGHRVIALDESAEEGEGPSPALLDRLAFHVSLDGIPMSALSEPEKAETETLSQSDLSAIDCPDDLIEELVALAVQLGVTSLRAPTLAVNAARAHAALNSRISVDMTDIQIAAELVLAPRATRLPQEAPDEPEAPESTAPETPSETPKDLLPQELLLEAIQTALPAGLLDKTGSDKAKSGSGSGSGAK